MSHLIVITFDNEEEAGNVMESLNKMRKDAFVSLDDSAVIVKDEEGKIHVKNEIDRGIKVGAGVGSMLGLFIGFFFGGPLGSLVVGGLGGALVGKMADMGVDKKFVKQVSDDLQPGSSALFIIVRDSVPNAAISALKPYQGNVYHTSLPSSVEDELRNVLKDRR
jgi:uncharacterized membrane protein